MMTTQLALLLCLVQPLKTAPEFVGDRWLNTDGKAISLASRKGKVTLVHFWTFACKNCAANLAAYGRWQKRFAKDDVVVIGIHTPELDFERDEAKVKEAIQKQGITFPVLLDPDSKNWDRWGQQYWPTVYVLDKRNRIRFTWTGELAWEGADGENQLGSLVQRLLQE